MKKTIFVSGGSKRIGKSICEYFHKNDFNIICHFNNSEKEAERDLPKTLDTDNLVNVQSGGLNRQKQQFRKEHPGDNPMAVEDKITEQDLANSLRTQYESFKQSYQDEAKFAEKQGTDHDKDGDIDSKDYLKSRDIAIKKAMAKKD